jgi:sarcosine oxidase subunit gamma
VSDDSVTLGEVSFALAWNVQGNPAQSSFVLEAERLLGVQLPLQPDTTTRRAGNIVFSLGPRSWLLVAGPTSQRNDFRDTRVALNAVGGALFDVSSSYIGWLIVGGGAARVLNRSCPLDFDPSVFRAGRCAQSMLGHINALFYKMDERPAFIVMTARSLAVDAWRDLCASATTDGYRIVAPTSFHPDSSPGNAAGGDIRDG